MKKILSLITGLILVMAFIGCSEEEPSFRVYNERSTKANVQIKPSAGNTINVNDVEMGQTSLYQVIPEGSTEITAVIQGEAISPETIFKASNDYSYTIVIANTNPPTLRVDSKKN
jgi:hypothetical protein